MKRKILLGCLTAIPIAVICIFAWMNVRTARIEVKDGVADASVREADDGPFAITGQWMRYAGAHEPEDLEGLVGEVVPDIRNIRRMRGYTYTFVLKTSEGSNWYFLMPRPHSSRLWLNGTEVSGLGALEEGRSVPLSSEEIYRLRDYTDGEIIRVVLQVSNSSIYDVYQGLLLGNRENLTNVQYRWMKLDLIAVGLSIMLIVLCLALFLPKTSEIYLVMLAVSTLIELGHFLLVPRHPGMAFFHLGTTSMYRQLGVINYYVCQQFVPGENRPWMDRTIPAVAVITLLACLIWPESQNSWIQASYLLYMLIQAWILGKGVLHGVAEAPIIMAGCMLALGNELFYRLLYAGRVPQGVVDMQIMPAQYMRFAYIAAFALATCMKYGHKFCEADQLSVSLEKKVAEQTETLRQANETLVQAQKNRQRFLTDIVHNMRSPLFAMGGYLDLLRDAIDSPSEEQEKYLDMLDRKAEFMGKMTEDMFLIYRLEDGQLTLSREVFDISSMLEMCGQDALAKGQEKGIAVELFLEDKTCFMDGDRFRLKQAVDNVLDNAVRYSPPGGVIRIRQQRKDACCQIVIEDQGPGMDEEQIGRLFLRYESKGSGGKTGLGLSISNHLIHLHGGSLAADSQLGEGTRMHICLPIALSETLEKHDPSEMAEE